MPRRRLNWVYDDDGQEFRTPGGRRVSLHEIAGMLHDRTEGRFDLAGPWAGWRIRGSALYPPRGTERGPRLAPHNLAAFLRWAASLHAPQDTVLVTPLLPIRDAGAAMTPLDKPLKRELQVGGIAYTLVLDPDGLKLTEKGHRRGVELLWKDLVSGDAALASALKASLEAN